jgi:hypothetical protein
MYGRKDPQRGFFAGSVANPRYAVGSVKKKIEPLPNSLSTHISPP